MRNADTYTYSYCRNANAYAYLRASRHTRRVEHGQPVPHTGVRSGSG